MFESRLRPCSSPSLLNSLLSHRLPCISSTRAPPGATQGDIEVSLRNHTAHRDNVGWDAAYFSRDQHLVLKSAPFLEFLRHVGELMSNVEQYRAAREANLLHAYIVPEGLMYAQLSIANMTEFKATMNPNIMIF